MKALARWSVNNHVTVNLIMVFVIIAGIVTVLSMRRELFPQFSLDMINVSVKYPGASPEEVEEGICIKIEEKIKSIEGISQILSSANEGYGSITARLETNADPKQVLDDIKREVDQIDTFPENSKKPIITEIKKRDAAINVALYGNFPEKELRNVAEKIRDDLVDTDTISLADLAGTREYEISIEISEEDLRRYGLTFGHVVNAIKARSVDLPGGSVKTAHSEVLIRSKGQLYTGNEFKKLPLITLKDGTIIYLGQIAKVIDGFEDVSLTTRFNGKPAVLVQINRTDKEDVIKISKTVKNYIKTHKNIVPTGMEVAIWGDLSVMVQDRISLLLKNGTQGIFLVFLVLAIFLNLRLAFWVAIGIPISFMGAFLVLDITGATINMISLFAFIMTLGILVDDAIIVGENVFSHYRKGKSPEDSVIDGLGEVGWPVVMAIATTVVAFMPLMFIAGIMGKFISVMPKAVIAILIVSLFEALIILPTHLKQALVNSMNNKSLLWHERISKKVEKGLDFFIVNYYSKAIKYVVKNRYFTFSIGIAVLIISLSIVISGYVPFLFFPKGESNWLIAEVAYPLGTPFKVTEKTIAHIEDAAFELNSVFLGQIKNNANLVKNTFAIVGAIPRKDWNPPSFGDHCGEVWIELLPSEKRKNISTAAVLNQWRSLVGQIPGIKKLLFSSLGGGPSGRPIEIQLAGNNFTQLKQASRKLKNEISSFPGTFDVTDDFIPGKIEKRFKLKQGASSTGITMFDIAKQLRQAFSGEEVLRIQRGRDDITVRVRYSEKNRTSISSIEDIRIRTKDGRQLPIEEVADITLSRAYSTIRRADRKRVITVSSDLDETKANASRIIDNISKNFLKKLVKEFPGIKINLEGQEKRTRESLASLKKGFLFAMILVFLLLASQFRSYIQPLIIMMAIPFGLIGAIFGHLVMGMPITMISLFGIVALSGIVVNDSLILIDFINKAIIKGVGLKEAVINSGKQRFRPVLLTSITTIAGLLPILLERSFQAQFLIPMAVSISFGLLIATLLTLLYVPALYLIIEDIRNIFKKN